MLQVVEPSSRRLYDKKLINKQKITEIICDFFVYGLFCADFMEH